MTTKHQLPHPPPVYFEKSARKLYFHLLSTTDSVQLLGGTLGHPALALTVIANDAEHLARLLQYIPEKLIANGFEAQPIKQPLPAICAQASELWTDAKDDARVNAFFSVSSYAAEYKTERRRLLHFPNGFSYPGNLELELFAAPGLYVGLVCEGDVHVDGVLAQLTFTFLNDMVILGNVHAHSLAHSDSHLLIEGDLRVANVVYGEYNDGSLRITGDVHGKAFISGDHDMSADGKLHLPSYNSGYDDDPAMLSKAVLDDDGGLDTDKLRAAIYARKSVLKRGYRFVPPVEASPAVPTFELSALAKAISPFNYSSDVEGLHQCLLNWPAPDAEWAFVVRVRISIPSTSPEDRIKLTAALQAHPELAPAIDVEAVNDALAFAEWLGEQDPIEMLKTLKVPVYSELIALPTHGQLALVEVIIKWHNSIRGFGDAMPKAEHLAFEKVLRRMLELGADAHATSEDAPQSAIDGATELKLEAALKILRS